MLPANPTASVRGPKHVVKKGLTPVLLPEEARSLIDAIDTGTIAGLRNRALIGVMVLGGLGGAFAIATVMRKNGTKGCGPCER